MSGRKTEREEGRQTRFTTLKVRPDPTPEQKELFEKTFGCYTGDRSTSMFRFQNHCSVLASRPCPKQKD